MRCETLVVKVCISSMSRSTQREPSNGWGRGNDDHLCVTNDYMLQWKREHVVQRKRVG